MASPAPGSPAATLARRRVFETVMRGPSLQDLLQHAIDLQHVRLSVDAGTNPDELWIDIISIAERIAQSVDCHTTDMLEAGELKVKWRLPHLFHFPNGHTPVTLHAKGWNTVTCTHMDYTKSPLAIKYSPVLAWKVQAKTHRSQSKIISSAYPSIERAIQALDILRAQREAAHDPLLSVDASALRLSLSRRISAVCSAIAGFASAEPGGTAVSTIPDIVDAMGDCFIRAHSLRVVSKQTAGDSQEEPQSSAESVTPVSPHAHASSAPAAAVSSAQRRRELRQTMQAKRDQLISAAGDELALDIEKCDARDHRPSSLAAAAKMKGPTKAERAKAADRLEKLHERNEASEFISRLTRTSHAARKDLQKARMKSRQEAKAKAKNTPMAHAFSTWKRIRRRRVAATFHSVLINVEVSINGTWKRIVAIADTGSGPTLVRLSDTALDLTGLEESDVTLFTADGSPFKDLVGATDVQFRFPGFDKVYDARSQVVDREDMTPIIGVDFFKRHKAHFNFEDDCIVIPGDPAVPGDGDIELPFSTHGAAYVPSASDDATKRKRAARASRQRTAATTQSTAEHETSCYALIVDDIVIPAGVKNPQAVQVEIAGGDKRLHCTQALLVEGEPIVAVDLAEEELTLQDDPRPEHSVLVSAVPDTVVRPSYDTESGRFWAAIPIGNPNPTEDLVIRRGTRVAAITAIPWSRVHRPAAQGDDSARHAEAHPSTHCAAVSMAASAPAPDFVNVDKSGWSEQDILIDGMNAAQMHEYVLQGHTIGARNFADWQAYVGEDMKFAPDTPDDIKERIWHVLYALQAVIPKDMTRPGFITGVEHEIHLRNPDTEPVKVLPRRYSPMERKAIDEVISKLRENDIIEYSDSPWCAPMVLVRKKDNTWRTCINYAATVNPRIKHQAQPLPRI